MMRLLPAFLACALALSAQNAAAPARIAVIDAVAIDAAGHPLKHLTPADFEVTEDGKPRTVVRLTEFDTVRHTAATIGELPALELTPDRIHRTIAIVVDDLCLSAAGVREARRQMRQMAETRLVAGDRVAILRTSSGSARERQFTSDPRQISTAVDAIQFLGGSIGRQSCASAAWSTVSYALTGLSPIPGRKALVLLSGDLPAPGGMAGAEIARLAAKSTTALYLTGVAPMPAAAPTPTAAPPQTLAAATPTPAAAPALAAASAPSLAASSGGAAGVDLDRVLEEQRSFYALGFASGGGRDVLVKLRRPELTLRSRTSAISLPPRADLPAPPAPAELSQQVMNSPFEGTAIGVQLTAMFSSDPKEGAIVEAPIHIDARDLSYLRDQKGKYHLEFEMYVASVLEAGQIATPASRAHTIELTEEEYRRLVEEGLMYTIHLTAWTAGARQIRVAVVDSRSGRTGSASAFVEVYDLVKGGFFLSGIALRGASPAAKVSPAVRAFHAGQPLGFVYHVYNPAVDEGGRSEVQSQARIFAEGREIYTGRLIPLRFEPGSSRQPRPVNGTISLDPSIGRGRYVLQLTVTDKLHPQSGSASQFVAFTIEP